MGFQKHLFVTKVKRAAQPTEQQLAVINRFALRELKSEEVYVGTAYLAHNAIDRDREVFDDALLADFARTLPGKGLFIKHPLGWDGDTGPGVGRWFEARVVEMPLEAARAALREPDLQFPSGTTVAKLLEASFYFPRSEKNAGLIADIEAGVAGDVSIGFRAADRTSITDTNGTYVASRLQGPGEAMEGSLVWLGAQPGARIHKSAAPGGSVDALVRQNQELRAEVADLQRKLKQAFERETRLIEQLPRTGSSPTLQPSPGARLRDATKTAKALNGDAPEAPPVERPASALRDPNITVQGIQRRQARMRWAKRNSVPACDEAACLGPGEYLRHADAALSSGHASPFRRIDLCAPIVSETAEQKSGPLRDERVTRQALGEDETSLLIEEVRELRVELQAQKGRLANGG